MRCKEAYVCLFAAQSFGNLPLALRKHLARCAKCRQRLQRLQTLEADFQQTPAPEVPANVRAAILHQLGPMTAPVPEEPVSQPRSPRRSPWLLAAAAALLLAIGLGLGWGLGRLHSPQPLPAGGADTIGGPREVAVHRILESDLRLADATTAPEQVNALVAIADELRREALRLAREGPTEDVALISDLYERIVYLGLVRRVRALPVEQQTTVAPILRVQFEKTTLEADRAGANASIPTADALRALGATARRANRALQGDAVLPEPRAVAWQPARSGTMRDLLAAVVMQGLCLVEDGDPLRQADGWADVADHFVQGILLASATGDAAGVERLASSLGSVMDRGVVSNLERYQTSDPRDERRKEVEKIGGRSAEALAALEKNLDQPPAAAQAGLQRAVDAIKKDKEPKGKGKGHRPDKALPPGWQKKMKQDTD